MASAGAIRQRMRDSTKTGRWRTKKGQRCGRRSVCYLKVVYWRRPAKVRMQRTRSAGLAEFRATESTFWTPLFLSYLAKAYAELRQLDDAWRSIDEVITAVQATKETLCEAEIHRVAGEIALLSPERDVVKAEAYFERALAVARQQQAKSWELRAATSLARLWRDQDKVQQACQLLAPIYGWFTEGFDTRDLNEAKALLDELTA